MKIDSIAKQAVYGKPVFAKWTSGLKFPNNSKHMSKQNQSFYQKLRCEWKKTKSGKSPFHCISFCMHWKRWFIRFPTYLLVYHENQGKNQKSYYDELRSAQCNNCCWSRHYSCHYGQSCFRDFCDALLFGTIRTKISASLLLSLDRTVIGLGSFFTTSAESYSTWRT